jgi:flagellar hook protein FlgE
VNISSSDLQYAMSTTGTLTANVPSTATAVTTAANLPSAATNSATTQYTDKASMTVYDALGTPEDLDIYLTKTGTNTWEATAYPKSAAAASGGFPYSATANSAANGSVGTVNLTFDATTGALTTASAKSLSVKMTSGATVAVNLSGMTQLATDFGVTTNIANGNAPSKVSSISIGVDGTVTENFASGAQVATYKIPVATVPSPDNLEPLSGNVYQVSSGSGPMILSTAGTNGAGQIESNTLEASTVDLATELTNMITAQRAYEANSKVLQTSSDLLGVLNRISTS